MKTHYTVCRAIAMLVSLTAANIRADEEQDLIAVLQSNAISVQKCEACVRLRTIGTPKAVPAIAALLRDERVSQAARHALDGMPFPEAVAALRGALGTTSGQVKAGIIDSLGWKRDTDSAVLLAPFLMDNDPMLASSAATALGRIGGTQAISALTAARDKAAPSIRPLISDALLQCAASLREAGKLAEAEAICRGLLTPTEPEHIRIAAHVGAMLAARDGFLSALKEALLSSDPAAQAAALRLAGETRDTLATRTFTELLPKVQPALQIGLLGAIQQRGDTTATSAVIPMLKSSSPGVVAAALATLGVVGDAAAVPYLAKAAASSDEPCQRAAREALIALRHGDVTDALVRHIPNAPPAIQIEIVRALTARGEKSAVPDLIAMARSDVPRTRKVALQAVAGLADSSSLESLVRLMVDAKDATAREEIQDVIESLAGRISSARDLNLEPVVGALATTDLDTRSSVLRVAALFVDPRLRAAFRANLKDTDPRVQNAAARALCNTRDPDLMPDLLELARGTRDTDLRSLAIAGYIQLVSDDRLAFSAPKRAELLAPVFALASRAHEKKAVLSALAAAPDARALRMTEQAVRDPDVKSEAEMASLQIGKTLAESNPEVAESALVRLSAEAGDSSVRMSARSALKRLRSGWLCAGPYRAAGKQCQELFDIAFAPEQDGRRGADWRRAPGSTDLAREGEVDLASAVGGDHCVVYLKTRLYSPTSQDVMFLIGSDDGIKLWLNGELVHANNAVRGLTPDQDKAKGALRAGWNDLLAKITQHTAGCGMTLRVTSPNGTARPDLVFDPAGGNQQ